MHRVPTCHRTFLTSLAAPLPGLAALAWPAAHAEAATVAVSNGNGSGPSLRGAITNAAGDDTIDMNVREDACER